MKKSSVSRRLMKQKKKKEAEETAADDEKPNGDPAAAYEEWREKENLSHGKSDPKKREPESWTLSGRCESCCSFWYFPGNSN